MLQFNNWKQIRYKGSDCVLTHEKINEANCISTDNAVCAIVTNTSEDILMQLYHDVDTDINKNEDYHNSVNGAREQWNTIISGGPDKH